MKTKRKIGFLLACLFTLTSLAGCSGGSGGTAEGGNPSPDASETTAATSPGQEEPITLTVMCHSSWRNDGTNAAFAYVEKALNIKFGFEEAPEGDAGEQLIQTKISSGEVPDILWWQSAGAIETRIGAEKFEDLSGIRDWTADYNIDSVKTTSYYSSDGRQIMAPFGDAGVFGIVYNKKVFQDAGVSVPTTWDEFLQVCETLKNGEKITPVYLSGKDAWTLQILMLDALGKEVKEHPDLVEGIGTNKLHWSDLELVRTSLTNLQGLIAKGYVQDSYLSDSYVDAQMALIDGTAAMYPMATWVAPELAKVTDDKSQLENIGLFTVPGSGKAAPAAITTPWGLGVPAEGKQIENAKKAVAELCSPEAAQAMYDVQPGIPFVKGVDGKAIGLQKDATDIINKGSVVSMPQGMLKYQVSGIETKVQDVLVGNITAQEALKSFDDDIAKLAVDANDPNW